LIAGTQVWNKRKTCRRRHKNAQKIISGVTLTKRAHLVEQTGMPCEMHDMVNTWAHLSACQRKEPLGEAHLGSADPKGQSNLDSLPSRCTSGKSRPYSTSPPWRPLLLGL
jgi:hypothetical protein